MRKIPFSVKLFLSYFLIVALFSVGVLYLVSIQVEEFNRDNAASQLHLLCLALLRELEPLAVTGKTDELDREAKDFGRQLGIRITVIRPDGVVLADSDHDPVTMDNHGSRPEVVGALTTIEGHSVRFSRTLQDNLMYLAMRFPRSGEVGGILRVSMRVRKVDALWAELGREILAIAAACLLGALLLAWIASRRLGQPVQKLAWAAEQLSRGNFQTRVFLNRHDELRDLADGFNHMAEEVNRLFQELAHRSEEHRIILASIQEGLVVVDRDARIAHANEAFWKIVRGAPSVGKPYWEVLRAPNFADGLRQVKEGGASAAIEVSLDDRTFLCGLTPIAGTGATVALFFDVTERKRLEDIKRELVVNISHEFKTPLTSIRGFAEALEEEPAVHREYVEIIRRNAERLARITDDLLLLARLEQPAKAPNFEAVDVREVAESTARLFQAGLGSKRLSFEISAAADLPKVSADRFLLEQVFINLLENAVRYTETGGVTVRLRREGREVVVEVADTGIGIAAEHLPRIFERFYVVDRSRSRATGGTGLGLSIVKNIVLQHGGRIDIQSRPGEGTTVMLAFPALS